MQTLPLAIVYITAAGVVGSDLTFNHDLITQCQHANVELGHNIPGRA
jgi:hypothetical protein